MGDVISLYTPNVDALELLEGIEDRLRSGESVAIAIVEVKLDGTVATSWSDSKHFHHLNSGAATLSARLAREDLNKQDG